MAIRFKRVQRLCDPTNKEAGKKVYPVISYQYDTSATLDEFAKEISSTSGVSEGETIRATFSFQLKAKERKRRKILLYPTSVVCGFVFVRIRISVSLRELQRVRMD